MSCGLQSLGLLTSVRSVALSVNSFDQSAAYGMPISIRPRSHPASNCSPLIAVLCAHYYPFLWWFDPAMAIIMSVYMV